MNDNKSRDPQPPPMYISAAPPAGFVTHQPPVIVHQTVTQPIAIGPSPCSITCPSCRKQIQTKVEYEANTRTHLIAVLLFVFMCWCCCCVPYCMDSCQNANHSCPHCGAYIGTYSS